MEHSFPMKVDTSGILATLDISCSDSGCLTVNHGQFCKILLILEALTGVPDSDYPAVKQSVTVCGSVTDFEAVVRAPKFG